mgnify:CR=1 FL=1
MPLAFNEFDGIVWPKQFELGAFATDVVAISQFRDEDCRHVAVVFLCL